MKLTEGVDEHASRAQQAFIKVSQGRSVLRDIADESCRTTLSTRRGCHRLRRRCEGGEGRWIGRNRCINEVRVGNRVDRTLEFGWPRRLALGESLDISSNTAVRGK